VAVVVVVVVEVVVVVVVAVVVVVFVAVEVVVFIVCFSSAPGESRSTITSSKVGVDFQTPCHRGFFAVTAKLPRKRAHSITRRGR
jgi:hypothetical protein